MNQLLTSAISIGVSDIHFEPFEDVSGYGLGSNMVVMNEM
jgi:hypothetical protein